MTGDSLPSNLGGDSPKQSIDEDEFGLQKIVGALSQTLTHRIKADGYVLGIQGRWGSGKSSFANFVAQQVAKDAPSHEIIRYDPWLVGEKSALLSFFLAQLASRLEEIERSHLSWWRFDWWILRKLRSTLGAKVRKYGEYAALLATPVGSFTAVDPTGATALTAIGLKGAGYLKRFFDASAQSLDKLKANIAKELLTLKEKHPEIRFTVIIDDTDRLEPLEAVEILRLARTVADFPLITYVVCFDEDVLSRQIKTALNVDNGHEYVEKIFQNVISIPPQEPFALRRYLRKLLTASFAQEMMQIAEDTNDLGYREHVVLDVWVGTFALTPRDVVRLYEAVKLGWSNVPAGADFLDFIWLQLIKLKVPSLYKWTQNYLTNVASYRDAGGPGSTEPEDQAKKLYEIMKKYNWHGRAYLSGLDDILPGVNSFVLKGDKQKVFEFRHDELAKFEKGRRLGSPTHWRQYFAFDLPTYALSDEYIDLFRKTAVERPSVAAAMLRELVKKPHTKVGHFVDVLLDRLSDLPSESFGTNEIRGMAVSFADAMDDIARETQEFEKRGNSEIWRRAFRLLNRDVAPDFGRIVQTGKSINWLAEVVRDQGLAHGRPDSGRSDTHRQWLDPEQLEVALTQLIERFKAAGTADVFKRPAPLDILFCWLQLGDKDEVRAFVQSGIADDDGFLNALSSMRGWSSSSNEGIRHPLRRQYIDFFLDADEARARLEEISTAVLATPDQRRKAAQLLADWTDESFP